MKFINPFKTKAVIAAALASSFLLCGEMQGGTAVGFFPSMNGGFEGETPGLVSAVSSIAAGTVSTGWTVSSTVSISGSGPSISTAGGRSGPYCVTNFSCASATTRRLQSPTAANGAVLGGAAYVVQFYYRTSGSTTLSNLQGGASPSGTGIPSYSPANNTVAGTSGAWVKFAIVETNQAGTGLGIGVVRFAGLSLTNIDVDDFVVYPGSAVDNTPPEAVTGASVPTVSGESVTLNWTAPGSGVDGGGYLVVRGTADPTTAPKVNGIYAAGNPVDAGQTAAFAGTNTSFTDTNLNISTTYYYRIYTVDKAFNYSAAASVSATTASTLTAPTAPVVSPSSLTAGAGGSATFTVTLAAGDPPLTYYWYQETEVSTNLMASASGATLTLTNVLGGDGAGYQVVVSNSVIGMSATSQVAALTVTNDPNIVLQPNSTFGLLNGAVQFTVSAAGTSPSYQWYQFDSNSLYTAYNNGPQVSGAVVTGATSSTLTIANLQPADATNFVVVVYNNYGSVTSSVVSLFSVTNTAVLTYWDFNGGATFTGANPAPYYGAGTAFAVGSAIGFSGVADPQNGLGTTPHLPNYSWGTQGYPASNANPVLMSNKLNGVQFNVSTVGANNIRFAYDARATGTASDFERVQYTTNGTTWIDYPSSTSFNGLISLFYPFTASFVGFPGVANNPNFGIRIVSEFVSTATYGNTNIVGYVGAANTYGTAGTLTYDLVSVSGDAFTNSDTTPTISAIPNTNTPDYLPLTLNVTVGDNETPAGDLALSATSLLSYITPNFSYGGSGADRTLTITPNPGQDGVAPILVTVTDGSGQSAVTWFYLTNTSPNLAPTTSLAALPATNTLENTALAIPFTVADDHTANSALVYTLTSDNNTLMPNANLAIGGTAANPTLIITPAAGQIGVALLTVSIADDGVTVDGVNHVDPRTAIAKLSLMVRPDTNIVLVDEFDYDNSGAIDTVSADFWTHLSGNMGQMQVGSGFVTVDTLDNTENLQAVLLGGPYRTNSAAVLYASYTVNLDSTLDPNKMPQGNGTYFTVFNDGSGVTGPYECRLVAATNGAAPGYYRLGINNFGADATTGKMMPLDLAPGNNYLVVTALVLSNGLSTLWINPVSQYSTNVTDPTASSGANLYNIADFELRESGTVGGSVGISNLLVGTSFSAVTGIYPPLLTNAGSATFTVGNAGTFNVGASGTPAPAFSASGPLPGGVTFDPVAGVLAGTPVAGSGGFYPLTITATNVQGTNVQNFSLIVNEAPSITSASSVTFNLGSAAAFHVTASGYPPPTFSESGALPGGVTLNPATGVLGGTPAAAPGAAYPLVITANNGVLPNASQNFALTTANTGQPPDNTIAASLGVDLNQIQIKFTGVPGQSYVVQSAGTVNGTFTDLAPGTLLVADATGLVQITVTPAGTQQYYRIRTGP